MDKRSVRRPERDGALYSKDIKILGLMQSIIIRSIIHLERMGHVPLLAWKLFGSLSFQLLHIDNILFLSLL